MWQPAHPACGLPCGHQRRLERPVKPLDQAVRLGVVGGGVDIFDRQRLPQFRPKRGGELGAAVRGEVGGDR